MQIGSESWAVVEEKLAMDFAIWKSKVAAPSRPREHMELVEGAWMKMLDRGLATIILGKLEWELAPPSGYTGYCEKQEDWLLVSRSRFRVALRSPRGLSGGVLQVCPCSGELEGLGLQSLTLEGGVDISGVMTRFFTSAGVKQSTPPTLQRTVSQKKHEEIIGIKFGLPFLKCVSGVRNAAGVADVFDSILGFSAAYVANQHILQPISEESDMEDAYFYDIEGMQEARSFNMERRNSSAWVRNQVRDAAMKCQVAAEAISEAAKLGSRMLCNVYDPAGNEKDEEEKEIHDPMETDDFEFNTRSGFQMCSPMGSVTGPPSESEDSLSLIEDMISDKDESDCMGISFDDVLIEIDSCEVRVDAPAAGRTPSCGSETATSSATSWEFVKTNDVEEEEDDVFGAGVSDAESLNSMLRDRDPFGCDGCSNLVTEFLSLSLNSAEDSYSTDQEKKVDGNEVRKSSVLERLASWSSSNSSSSSATDRDGPSFASKKIQTVQLESLAEEPACDAYIASICRCSIIQAAAVGDVLQWCSCKFNKLRSSIELRFQVGSFMEDDIATLSTGISRASPIRIEIFLDSTNVRHSLLEGRVRISTDQGAPEWPYESASPVIGLSCYIPHLVRQYLQQSVREQANKGYDFPDGELVTGIMQHVVAKLVFQKYSCCICNEPSSPDMIISMVPKPCDQNLCQALHELWLVVAPRMVLKHSTIANWMRHCCFEEGFPSDEELMMQYMECAQVLRQVPKCLHCSRLSYDKKLENVMSWIKYSVLAGSWLKVVEDSKLVTDQELQFPLLFRRDSKRRIDQGASFETYLQIWLWLSRFHARPPSSLGSI